MSIREELVEQQTILIALDDKLHKFMKIQARLRDRITALEEKISGREEVSVEDIT